ncbi:RidA family protein [Paraburkholderia oxyphila]|uniref:RidA family protein n=1 Tax=Paraburkholderia oxyphila TaxID=614212 RepID=UPI0004812ACF|nr:RidA family protein [Paraburkholderia oxyphila]
MSKAIERLHVSPRMSQIVIVNGFVYLAGQVPDVVNASVSEQTYDILNRIDALLADAGVDKTYLVSATIWLTDPKHFAAFNAVWEAWIPEGQPPTRACVQSQLMKPGCDVEIAVIALADSRS